MILTALADYYDRRRKQPGDDTPPPFGYSQERVGYALVLDQAGQIVQVADLRTRDQKGNPQAQPLPVPRPLSGRSGKHPRTYFLADNTRFVLGAGASELLKPNERSASRIAECDEKDRDYWNRCRDKHLAYLKDSDDPGAVAVRKFFETWDPTHVGALETWPEMAGGMLVFKLDGEPGYIHEREALKAIWQARFAEENESAPRQCLVTGEQDEAALLHPPIKGVKGAQPAGAGLVTFNKNAFCSYSGGTSDQGLNAPVSQHAAFAYTTALNELLRFDSRQKLQLGETSIVFWADRETPFEDVVPAFFAGSNPDQTDLDPDTRNRLKAVLERIGTGIPPHDTLADLDGNVRFYVLGLAAPSQARLTVRFWYVTTLGHLLKGVAQHAEDLRIQRRFPDREPEMPPLWSLIRETAVDRKLDNALSSLYAGLLQAVMARRPYPRALLGAVLERIRVECGNSPYEPINHPRAALIKATLRRAARHNNQIIPSEIDAMSLDTETTDVAYRLGRLFAVMEKAQKDALGQNLNRTIRDSYFATASAAPRAVFPRLLRLTQHHISKADYGVTSDKRIAEVVERLTPETAFPPTLSLEAQGRFVLGYYHQRNHTEQEIKDKTAAKAARKSNEETSEEKGNR